MIGIDELVTTLKEGEKKVSVQLEYSETKQDKKFGNSRELGVRIRICAPGEHGAACKYTSLHFHYATKQSSLADAAPIISAHFKTGQSKVANQGMELKVYDAYALYILMTGLAPTMTEWKPLAYRVTKTKIANLTKANDLRALRAVFVSKVFDLAFWDSDAWTAFLDWQTSP